MRQNCLVLSRPCLLQFTAESDSEDEEAQLEAAEHLAAYNLEAPSTAPATTGSSTTGGSTQTGSGLGTAAGGSNAVPRAAENGAAQPPAEVCKPQLGSVLALAPAPDQKVPPSWWGWCVHCTAQHCHVLARMCYCPCHSELSLDFSSTCALAVQAAALVGALLLSHF